MYLIKANEDPKDNVVTVVAADPLCDAEGAEALQGRQRTGVQRFCQTESQGVCEEVHGQVRPRLPKASRRVRLELT